MGSQRRWWCWKELEAVPRLRCLCNLSSCWLIGKGTCAQHGLVILVIHLALVGRKGRPLDSGPCGWLPGVSYATNPCAKISTGPLISAGFQSHPYFRPPIFAKRPSKNTLIRDLWKRRLFHGSRNVSSLAWQMWPECCFYIESAVPTATNQSESSTFHQYPRITLGYQVKEPCHATV